MIKSAYIWNSPASKRERQALAALLADIGCQEVYIKACGDQGTVWIEGRQLPAFARAQWSPADLIDYTDKCLKVTPWSYPWPGLIDQDGVLTVLDTIWADNFVLNPESEWRVQWATSPYSSLAEANAYARKWMQELKAMCLRKFGKVPSFGLSSCPSWSDFPYEGFAAECDFFLPEHYFFPEDMAKGEDMVAAHIRRAGTARPCIPVLTASREYDDAGVLRLAHTALEQLGANVAGLSCWEAGNPAFQGAAMQQAYTLLPEEQIIAEEHKPVAILDLPYNISDNPAAWHCEPTDKWVVNPHFLELYRSYGDKALATFGLPVGGEYVAEDGIVEQYFERARFEIGTDGGSYLGLVGAELVKTDYELTLTQYDVEGLTQTIAELHKQIDTLLQTPKLPKKIAQALGDLIASSVAPGPTPQP